MRLGVVGMMPADFRDLTAAHLAAIADLQLTGASSHAPIDGLGDVTRAQCAKVRALVEAAGMDFVQFGLGYGQCLFDRDATVIAPLLDGIGRGIEIAAELRAHFCLLRTGSLNPAGSYSPCKENFAPESRERLIETLKLIAAKAEEEGVTIVIETHALTIMGSPEANKEILAAVGSDRMSVVMDYVNHFQSLHQVYHSSERLNHIYDLMGPISTVAHCKDVRVDSGLVLHINEEVPGDGELDMVTALQRWQALYPDGYMLLEHLGNDRYPHAAANVRGICTEAGIEIH